MDINAEFVIYDEAHRTTSTEFSKSLSLNGQKLFMTATPKVIAYADDDEIIEFSMDNMAFYGKEIYNLTMHDAITKNLITDYNIHVPLYFCENHSINNLDKNILHEKHIDNCIKVIQNLGNCHLITYHNTIQETKDFSAKLINVGLHANYIDGDDSMRNKMSKITKFTNEKSSILCSCRALTEGVNIPICDAVMFVEPKSSHIGIIQAIGRVLRVYDNKNIAKIIIPTYDVESNKTIEFIQNLMNYDPMLKIQFKTKIKIEQFNNESKDGDIEDKIKRFKLNIEQLVLPKNKRKTVMEHIDYVKKFKEENGRIPIGDEYSNINVIRYKYKADKLSEEEKIAIDNIDGFMITTEQLGIICKSTMEHIEFIKKFSEENNRIVSQKEYNGIARIRLKYKNNKLTEEEKNICDSISNLITKQKKISKTILEHILSIRNFVEENQRIPTLQEYPPIQYIRNKYKKNKLSKEEKNIIESVNGFMIEDSFNKHILYIQNFKQKNNRIPSIEEYTSISTIRQHYKNNILSENERKIAYSIDGLILHHMNTFCKYIDYIKKFKDINNRVPKDSEYSPIEDIRKKYRLNKLTDEERDICDSIEGFMINLEKFKITKTFNEQVEFIKKFKEEHKRFPSQIEYKGIAHIRTKYKNNKLTKEEKAIVDELKIMITTEKTIIIKKTFSEHIEYITIGKIRRKYKLDKLTLKEKAICDSIEGLIRK